MSEYTPPTMVVLGTVEELTEGEKGSGTADGKSGSIPDA
jgi:hypothetical protein